MLSAIDRNPCPQSIGIPVAAPSVGQRGRPALPSSPGGTGGAVPVEKEAANLTRRPDLFNELR